MIKKTNKTRIFMYSSIIMALVLGVYGQDMSYYIDENIIKISPVYILTILTIISVLLFLFPPILIYQLNKEDKMGKIEYILYFYSNFLIGTITSIWSLFVLIMWWG